MSNPSLSASEEKLNSNWLKQNRSRCFKLQVLLEPWAQMNSSRIWPLTPQLIYLYLRYWSSYQPVFVLVGRKEDSPWQFWVHILSFKSNTSQGHEFIIHLIRLKFKIVFFYSSQVACHSWPSLFDWVRGLIIVLSHNDIYMLWGQ